MAAIDMTELQYAARGRSVVPGAPAGGPPPHILGMVSSVRAALAMVHSGGGVAAVARIEAKLGSYLAGSSSSNPGVRATATAAQNYIDCVRQYVTWDAAAALSFRDWQVQGLVSFSPTDTVDAMVRVVLERSDGLITGRVVLWDTAPLGQTNAEIIAAVAVDVLDAAYGAPRVHGVEIWHLRTATQHQVSAPMARSKRPAAAALVAGL